MPANATLDLPLWLVSAALRAPSAPLSIPRNHPPRFLREAVRIEANAGRVRFNLRSHCPHYYAVQSTHAPLLGANLDNLRYTFSYRLKYLLGRGIPEQEADGLTNEERELTALSAMAARAVGLARPGDDLGSDADARQQKRRRLRLHETAAA